MREARAIDVVALTAFAVTAAWLLSGYLLGFDAEGRGDAERAVATEAPRVAGQ